ncbi:MAG: chloride channel protein [Rhodobacteraceae bacterium]|nr:chloride channel protein [Paracoccaceae bacterium]
MMPDPSPLRQSALWSLAPLHSLRHHGPSQLRFWIAALVIGTLAGFATVGFRIGIYGVQEWIYGSDELHLASALSHLPWYWVLGVPMLGGLVVGLIMQRFTLDSRNRSVAHVIEGAALNGGRVEGKAGLASAAASFITLSTGGSAGREGPVVHIAALISSKISRMMDANGVTGRDLLGCAVASAVAASFNAPIAGTVFAMEVILRHYAAHAFGPIVVSAVIGALISRLGFGDITEFTLPPHSLEFYRELPAFVLLGLVCGLTSVGLMRAIFWASDIGDTVQTRLHIPRWVRPGISGLMLGMLAIYFPHIIGVGYETTTLALTGQIAVTTAIVFALTKALAVAITFAGRMGGGAFSPALMMGALTGLAFGGVATSIFPSVSGSETLYALAGMAAIGAAVLGAPLSTSLIVFEMTGDWQLGMAVMIAVAAATTIAGKFVARSFFMEQLERWNIHLAAGPQAYLLAMIPVKGLMRDNDMLVAQTKQTCALMIAEGIYVTEPSTLEVAFPKFEITKQDFIPVVEIEDEPILIGALYQIDALTAYTDALAETAREEHS